MNKEFCLGCNSGANIPKCAITLISNNAYLEDILSNKKLPTQECLICPENAQEISENGIIITKKCSECTLCMLACPNVNMIFSKDFFPRSLEKAILNDPGKACILFKCLFSKIQVASEVQVQGNFRTKRIDIVIKYDNNVLLVKLLNNIDKVPFYRRSYDEVIFQYEKNYSEINFKFFCLIPSDKMKNKILDDTSITDIGTLCKIIGGK